eukprot:Cvel_21383.t1-p1 / transcript=Cvel_21383.t1 / gene=Cvel_21383 / organism=Chromera_velia_CCMP2878 / gene_product=hypothetical protein / transcript_product=hypothetical protein / location=Cvel_scaffold2000:35355-35771(+) / protein_length=139 / sequence_SO=supercontig / SO=protein_coding / is_pseudo=false
MYLQTARPDFDDKEFDANTLAKEIGEVLGYTDGSLKQKSNLAVNNERARVFQAAKLALIYGLADASADSKEAKAAVNNSMQNFASEVWGKILMMKPGGKERTVVEQYGGPMTEKQKKKWLHGDDVDASTKRVLQGVVKK